MTMRNRYRGIAAAAVVTTAAAVAVCTSGAGAAPSAAGGQSYKFVGVFGKSQVSGPQGLTVASNGDVYVADSNNSRVVVFGAGGALKSKWGSSGRGNGQFAYPRDVDIAPNGTVWVADDNNGRAQGFSATGAYQSSLSVEGYSARGVATDASGDVLVAAEDGDHSGFRVFAGAAGSGGPLLGRGAYAARDIEASPDGTVFLVAVDSEAGQYQVRRYTTDGKPLGVWTIPNPSGLGIDPDCNVWAGDFLNRAITKYSPSGRKLATAASGDMQANDIAVARNGDLYVTTNDAGIFHFAENHAKPATAAVPGRIAVRKGRATIAYKATGFACPAQVDGVATLKGKGVSGRAAVKVAAGKTTAISMPVKAPTGQSVNATFTIVLKTNGRATTETRKVTVVAKK
jgi:sugar lactone lactonase YvrE